MTTKPATVFLVALLLVFLALCYPIAQPFFGPVMGAGVLAIALYPMHLRVQRLVRPETRAALVSLLLIVLVALVPLIAVGWVLTQELTHLVSQLARQSSEQGGWGAFFQYLIDFPIDFLAGRLPVSKEDLRQAVYEKLRDFGGGALKGTANLLGGIGSSFGVTILTLIVLVFFLRDGKRLVLLVRDLMPIDDERADRLFALVQQTITVNFYGVFAVAIAQGFLTGLIFAILGLPSPVTWGVIASFLSTVPLVGTSLVWIPAAAALVFQGALGKAIVLVAYGILVIGMADNIIRPWLVMGKVNQHPLLVMLSILGGMQAFGLPGVLFGPLIVSITLALIGFLREEMSGNLDASAQRGP